MAKHSRKKGSQAVLISSIIAAVIFLVTFGAIRYVNTKLFSSLDEKIKKFGTPAVVGFLSVMLHNKFDYAASITVGAVVSFIIATLDTMDMTSAKDFLGFAGDEQTQRFSSPEEAAQYLQAITGGGLHGEEYEMQPQLTYGALHGADPKLDIIQLNGYEDENYSTLSGDNTDLMEPR